MDDSVTEATATATPTASGWRRIGRWLLNGWLAFHCVALMVGPAATPPSSNLSIRVWELYEWYLMPLYINHGYRFFAPEPSAGTLLGYRLEFADGRIETGQFPHRQIEPRLLYHRYFMMSERIAALDDMEPALRQQWLEAYARAIGRETSATRVTLTRIRHSIPTMERIRAGGRLDDPDLFAEEFLGTFEMGR